MPPKVVVPAVAPVLPPPPPPVAPAKVVPPPAVGAPPLAADPLPPAGGLPRWREDLHLLLSSFPRRNSLTVKKWLSLLTPSGETEPSSNTNSGNVPAHTDCVAAKRDGVSWPFLFRLTLAGGRLLETTTTEVVPTDFDRPTHFAFPSEKVTRFTFCVENKAQEVSVRSAC